MASTIKDQSENGSKNMTSSMNSFIPPLPPSNCIIVGVRPNLRGQETLDFVFSKIARKADRIIILHVLQAVPPLPPLSMDNAETSKVLENAWWDVHRQKISDEVSHLLRPYKRTCRERKIDVQIRIIQNSVVEKTLIQEAANMKASRLIIGASDNAKLGNCNLPQCSVFKKERGPYYYILKHAPEGCKVLVIGEGKILHKSKRTSASDSGSGCFKPEKGKLFPIASSTTITEPPKTFVASSDKSTKKSSPIHFKVTPPSIHNLGRHTAKIIFSLSDGHSRRFSPSRFSFKEEMESPSHLTKSKSKRKGKSSHRQANSDILVPVKNSMIAESSNMDAKCVSEGGKSEHYRHRHRYDDDDELIDDAESMREEGTSFSNNGLVFGNGCRLMRNEAIMEEEEGEEEGAVEGEEGEERKERTFQSQSNPLVASDRLEEGEEGESKDRIDKVFESRGGETKRNELEKGEGEEEGGGGDEEEEERGERMKEGMEQIEFNQINQSYSMFDSKYYPSPEWTLTGMFAETTNPYPSPHPSHLDMMNLKLHDEVEDEDDDLMMTQSTKSYPFFASTQDSNRDDDSDMESQVALFRRLQHASETVGCSGQTWTLTEFEEGLLDRITNANANTCSSTNVRSWDDSSIGLKQTACFVPCMVKAKLIPNETSFFLPEHATSLSMTSALSKGLSRELKRCSTLSLPLLHPGNVNLQTDLLRVDHSYFDSSNLLMTEASENSTNFPSLTSPRSIVNGADFFSGSTKSAGSLFVSSIASKSGLAQTYTPLLLKSILETIKEIEEAERTNPSPSLSPSPSPSSSPSPSPSPFRSSSSPFRSFPSPSSPSYGMQSPLPHRQDQGESPSHFRRPSLSSDRPLTRIGSVKKGIASVRYFHFEELAYATNGFAKENMIGKGGYAYVFKGLLGGGQRIAVKRLLKKGKEVDFLTEVGVVGHVRHPHATALLGYCIEASHRLLVYDLMPHGSLERNLHGKRRFMSWSRRVKAAVGSARGLDYLHRTCPHRIIHRDVKSANILISADWNAQIADFGLAKWVPDTKTFSSNGPIEGTFGYMAPEYFMQGELNEKTDVYAFGVVLLEIITGRRPIDIRRPILEQNLVSWAIPRLESWNVNEFIDPKLNDDELNASELRKMCATAMTCLRVCPDYRPSMEEVAEFLENQTLSENQWEEIWGNLVEKKGCLSQIQRYSSMDAEYTDSMYKRDLENHMALALAISVGQIETN